MAEPTNTRAARTTWSGIRTRLVGVLLIPTLAALGLGGLRMSSAVHESADATRAASIASALPDSFRLALQLQVERDAFTQALLPFQAKNQIRATTDGAIALWRAHLLKIDSSHDPKLRQDLNVISGALDGMTELRAEAASSTGRLLAQTEYTNTLNTLLGLAGRLPDLGSANRLYRQASALAEVRTAAEALADERVIVTKALHDKSISQYDLTELSKAATRWEAASGLFYDNTSPNAQKKFEAINGGTGDLAGSHAPMQTAVGILLSTGDPTTLHMKAAQWNAASTQFLAQMAVVITTSATDLANAVDARRASAQRDAVVSAVAVFAVLLLALVATLVVARSILRPLSRLRQAALDIARHALPERVRRLEESDEVGDLSVSPIYVGSRDEISEVAASFDAVHAEAVRLAGEQTQMRANVNRMFVNLSRRSQSLVERQLRLIDELEAGEQDPDHLANLFRLDHLATRMRRNDESLMVLAGGDTGQAARGPVPVLDVLRAASSEVEQFARIEIESGETAKFRGNIAGDLVHLLAELIENATNFSPPDTTVVVRTTRTSPVSPLVIEVRDLGIGMSPAELDSANLKLRSDAGLDADVARMMGLVVASRLANRHDLVVELRANNPRGVVARVQVPTGVLVQPETRSALLVEAVEAVEAGEAVDALNEPLPTPAIAPAATAPAAPAAPVAPAPPEPEVAAAPAAPVPPVAETPGAAARQLLPNLTPAVRPPENYIPPSPDSGPIASESPVNSWFATTVPLRDPEELLNTYLTGRAEGTGGSIKSPFGSLAKMNRNAPVPPTATPDGGSATGLAGEAAKPANGFFSGGAPVPPTDLPAPPVTPAAPAAPSLTSSGLPTRVPKSSMPAEKPFDAFGSSTPAATPVEAPEPVAPEPVAETSEHEPTDEVAEAAEVVEAADGTEPVGSTESTEPTDAVEATDEDRGAEPAPPLVKRIPNLDPLSAPGADFFAEPATPATPAAPAPRPTRRIPELDPLIAELAADVLNAPSAQEALAQEDELDDDSSIFASLQSEWFTRRTPLEARRSQPGAPAEQAEDEGSDWVSPGDDGWRRAAELAEPATGEEDGGLLTPGGLPVRVPGRNLVPGSATPLITPAAELDTDPGTSLGENVVPLPRPERRRNRGLSSFQQGVSRARTTDGAGSVDGADTGVGTTVDIAVPPATDADHAAEARVHEEHQ